MLFFDWQDPRHTYAFHLASNGLSLSIVGKLLGRSEAPHYTPYAHLADEPLHAATELFGPKLNGTHSMKLIMEESVDRRDYSSFS